MYVNHISSEAMDQKIQALRALAIAMVLMAHAQLPGFEAGFIGVDVFLVISGYLVVGAAHQALQQGRFSVTIFLLARAWRLFPAAAVVLLAVLLAGGFSLLSAQWQALGKQVAVSVAGLQNVFLWRAGNDYFSPAIQEQPLMHLWSLAVEGQFYLALVLLAGVCAWRNWSLRAWLPGLLLVSLGVWAWGWLTRPVPAYYLLPPRGWEFMAGALVACYPAWRPTVSRGAWLLALALGAWLACQQDLPKPLLQGWAAVMTVFVLATPRTTKGVMWARLPGVQWLGRHAYVLYLVHWPVWVWIQHAGWWLPGQGLAWAWLPTTLVAAALLHRLVELPGIRAGRYWRQQPLFQRLACLTGLGLFWGLVGAAGLAVWYVKGWPERLPAAARVSEAAATNYGSLPDRCMMAKAEAWRKPFTTCRVGSGASDSAIVWGDSHAAAFITGWPAEGPRAVLLSTGGCVAVPEPPWKGAELCRELNRRWLPAVIASPAREVFLVGRWAAYARAEGYGFVDGLQTFSLTGLNGQRLKAAQTQPWLTGGLRTTVQALVEAGKRVTVVGPVPELTWAAPECHARRAWRLPALNCDEPLAHVQARMSGVEQALIQMTRSFPADRVRYVSALPALCDGEHCRSAGPEGIYYYDDDHLSSTGARVLLARLGVPSGDLVHISFP